MVVVADVLLAESEQVGLVQRDHVIQHLPAYALDPSLGHAILPRASDPGPNGFQSAALQKGFDVAAELAVVVEHDVSVRAGKRKRLPQLLNDPLAGRMSRGVEVQNATAMVLDNKEAVQHAKGQVRNRKEVERRDHLAMVVQKGHPAFGLLAVGAPLQTS